MKKLTNSEFIELIVDKELEIANAPVRYKDLIGARKDEFQHWYQDFCFDTVEQFLEWKQFFYDHFYDWQPKRVKNIDEQFSWINLQYGLKYNFPIEQLNEINRI
jgi:hypothetical protein